MIVTATQDDIFTYVSYKYHILKTNIIEHCDLAKYNKEQLFSHHLSIIKNVFLSSNSLVHFLTGKIHSKVKVQSR
jgi:hypothetical protein